MANMKKIYKTIFYRITASLLAQIISWIVFNKLEINTLILFTDLYQMCWYFFVENYFDDSYEKIKRRFLNEQV